MEKPARALFESLLNLHGLAFSGLAAALTRTTDGAAEFERLADTEPLRAILLLHGLHPIAAEKRARRAVDRMRPEILSRGCHLGPVEIMAGVLRVRLHGSDAHVLRPLLQNAIFDSAPDISDVLIEISGVEEAEPQRINA